MQRITYSSNSEMNAVCVVFAKKSEDIPIYRYCSRRLILVQYYALKA